MSKQFEDQYRQLAENETPDLWNRIEAGLNDKIRPSASAPTDQPANSPNGTPAAEPAAPPPSRPAFNRKLRKHARRYLSLAAALVCAVIIIPAALHAVRTVQNAADRAGEAPAADALYAEQEAVPEASYDDGLSAPAAEAAASSDDAGSPAAEEAAGPAGALTAGAFDAPPAEEPGYTDGLDAAANTEAAADEPAAENDQSTNGSLPEGSADRRESFKPFQTWDRNKMSDVTALTGVTVQVNAAVSVPAAADMTMPATPDGNPGEIIIYQAKVLKADSADRLMADDLITFIKGDSAESDIAVGKQYTLDLLYHPDTFFCFEVSRIVD